MRHLLAAAVLLAAACAKKAPVIEKGSQVKLNYTLKVDGQVVDSSQNGQPLSYTQGSGQIVPGLESQMAGHKTGDKFEATVAPKDGYGEHKAEGVRKVPWKAFGAKKPQLQVGQTIGGQADGRPFQAKVLQLSDDGPTLDLNHPLAGKTLSFSIEVLEVAPPAAHG